MRRQVKYGAKVVPGINLILHLDFAQEVNFGTAEA